MVEDGTHVPVLVGVGQFSERLREEGYAALSAVELAVRAAEAAFADAGGDLRGVVDVIGAVRQFDQSFPGAYAPLGLARNVPRAIARRLGIDPTRAIHERSGGQSPQLLVTELAGDIARGRHRAALVVGAEAISTVLAHTAQDPADVHGVLDFTDDTDGPIEDRGYGLAGLVSDVQVRQRLDDAPTQYSVFENARRSHLGLTRTAHLRAMGELFAPFTEVAARNPHSASRVVRTAEELVTITDDNRWIVDPYPRYLVSRDKVNQGAAVVLTSEAVAEELGVPRDKWVYLRGHCDLREQGLLDRMSYAGYPAAVLAAETALTMAGIGVADLGSIDLYSCFPVAVSAVADGLGLRSDDPRGLTVTGGLPFFGGPGNDYALHAVASTVERVRATPGSFGLVGANGGTMSKYSAAVYSTTPGPWVDGEDAALQAELDAAPTVPYAVHADGWATLETWTVKYLPAGPLGVVIGRLTDGRRFVANTTDPPLLDLLLGEAVPTGQRFFVRSHGRGNRASTVPPVPRQVGFVPSYDALVLHRDGHLLEIELTAPTLTPDGSQELSDVVDAFLADRELWVAILRGADDFCTGTDLAYALTGKPVWLPTTGFGGLTARRSLTKPLIAAIAGRAVDAGLELALACTLQVVDPDADLGLTQVRRGWSPGGDTLAGLAAALPPAVVHDLVLTGRLISAAEAERWGLVNRVAPPGGVLAAARALADELMAASPHAQSVALRLLAGDRADVPVTPYDDLLVSFDALEGARAITTGDDPRWQNR